MPNCAGIPRVSACGRRAGRVFLAIPEAHLVDKVGREDVSVADCDAVHIPFLRAVAIAAAIGDSGKWRGHLLRIVNLAVASEHLVLFVEMLVDAHIKGILHGGIDRGGLIVVFHPAQVLLPERVGGA